MARIESGSDKMPIVPQSPAPHDRGKAVRRDKGPQTSDQRIAAATKATSGSTVGAVNPIQDNDGDNDDD